MQHFIYNTSSKFHKLSKICNLILNFSTINLIGHVGNLRIVNANNCWGWNPLLTILTHRRFSLEPISSSVKLKKCSIVFTLRCHFNSFLSLLKYLFLVQYFCDLWCFNISYEFHKIFKNQIEIASWQNLNLITILSDYQIETQLKILLQKQF